MKKFLLVFAVVVSGCSHSTKVEKNPDDPKVELKTVDVAIGEEKGLTPTITNNKKEEFAPYRIKANRNKSLALHIGKLGDRMFVAIGIVKWLERNGYKVEELQVADKNENTIFSHLVRKKSSYLEWKLHQCCMEYFPLRSESSYEEIVKKMEVNKGVDSVYVEDSNCVDFQEERDSLNVVCISTSESNDEVEVSRTAEGMKLIKFFIAPLNYVDELSFVDFVERGYGLGLKVKNN